MSCGLSTLKFTLFILNILCCVSLPKNLIKSKANDHKY